MMCSARDFRLFDSMCSSNLTPVQLPIAHQQRQRRRRQRTRQMYADTRLDRYILPCTEKNPFTPEKWHEQTKANKLEKQNRKLHS